LLILAGCAFATNISDLAEKKIGVQTGTLNPEIVKKFIPTAKLEYFDTILDILTALKAGRIDAFCTGLPIARFMAIENDDIIDINMSLNVIS
jgi:ABC-type amino acid transport substrate-binding protein